MPPGVPPLIERDAELAVLVAALTDTPSVVTVEGEPGIGKTRLVQEALVGHILAGRQLLLGHARGTRQVCPLGPVLEALATADLPPTHRLSPLTGALRAVLPERADLLPPATPALPDRALTRHRMLRAVAQLLHDVGPLILVLEDLHWADDETLDLLDLLGTRPPPQLCLVITFRTYHLPAGSRLLRLLSGPLRTLVRGRIQLTALSERGTGTLAGHLLGPPTEICPKTANLLHARSGGIPFLLGEDVRLLHKRRALRVADGRWGLARSPDGLPAGDTTPTARVDEAVPDAVSADVMTQASRLSPAGRLVLDAAAVLATPVDPEILGTVAGLRRDQATSGAAEAEHTGLLREVPGPDPGPGFRCGLVRRAVYQAIPVARRRRLHARAARALAALDNPALADKVARHHREAGNPQAWARTAETAADLAADRGDLTGACLRLREVLRHTPVNGRRYGRLATKLGWAGLDHIDRATDIIAVLTEALRRPGGSRAQRAELRLLRALIRLDVIGLGVNGSDTEPGDTDSADLAVELRQAVGDLATRPDLQAIGLAILAQPTRLPTLTLATQLSYLSQARTALDHTDDPVAHAAVLATVVGTLQAIGSPGCWRGLDTLPGVGQRIHVDRQTVRGLLTAASAALSLGHYPRAGALAEQAAELAGRRGLARHKASLHLIRARARWLMGDVRAEAEARRLATAETVHFQLHAGLMAGQVLVGQGRLDAARDVLRTIGDNSCRIGELAVAAQAAAELNRAAATPADQQVAGDLTVRAIDRIAGKPNWVWAAPLLPFADLDLVRQVLPDYRRGVAGRDAPLARAALEFAEARLAEADGDTVGAQAGYAAARKRYAALPDPRIAAHACSAQARCLAAAGLPVDPDLLVHAWRSFHELGAAWDADRLKQQIRRAGMPAPHRRGRPGYGNRLSPREREIAAIAADGHTNQHIAVRLYLSERTVKYHLANAMRKLGVTSRRQLVDALVQRDGADSAPVEDRRDHVCRCLRCGRRLNLAVSDG